MDNIKILEVKQSIFASNDEQAAALRADLKAKKVFLLNLMSAPGSGKTTTLRRTIEALKIRSGKGTLTPMWMPAPSPGPGQSLSSCIPAVCATLTPK